MNIKQFNKIAISFLLLVLPSISYANEGGKIMDFVFKGIIALVVFGFATLFITGLTLIFAITGLKKTDNSTKQGMSLIFSYVVFIVLIFGTPLLLIATDLTIDSIMFKILCIAFALNIFIWVFCKIEYNKVVNKNRQNHK